MTTLVAASRRDGAVASLEFSGATDTLAFPTYLERVLLPCLRPGGIVVLDNLKPYRTRAAARTLHQVGWG